MAESVMLPREFIDQMVAHSREDQPNECCGVVARYADGRLKLFRATNAEASPYRMFALEYRGRVDRRLVNVTRPALSKSVGQVVQPLLDDLVVVVRPGITGDASGR